MEKKQVREGKSEKGNSAQQRRKWKHSKQSRGSIHESFDWSFVDENDHEDDFNGIPSYGKFARDKDKTVTAPPSGSPEKVVKKVKQEVASPVRKKQGNAKESSIPRMEKKDQADSLIIEVTPKSKSISDKKPKHQAHPPKTSRNGPQSETSVSPHKKRARTPQLIPKKELLFSVEPLEDDDDLSLPSYGRTSLKHSFGDFTVESTISDKMTGQKKKFFAGEPHVSQQSKSVANKKKPEKTQQPQPVGSTSVPPLPSRPRQRWDPVLREYVLEQSVPEQGKTEEKNSPPEVSAPKAVKPISAQKKKQPEREKPRVPKEPVIQHTTAPSKPQQKEESRKKIPQAIGKQQKSSKRQSVPNAKPEWGKPDRAVRSDHDMMEGQDRAVRPPKDRQIPGKQSSLPSSTRSNRSASSDMEKSIISGFQQFSLSKIMLESLRAAGYIEPTPIQKGVIPLEMQGVDVMGQAQTGTGKTAAFLIPIIERIEECEPGESPVALILVPTRELAVQVRDEALKLAYGRDIRISACYGGKPIAKQLMRLREGVDVIVGTPGRLLDLMNRRALSCDQLRWVVLDEADRMLDIGFRPDIEKILGKTPKDRQTLLFSATLPQPVVRLAQKYMNNPDILDFSNAGITVETIEQYYITIDQRRKFDALLQLLQQEQPKQAIIFCRTKRRAERVGRMLEAFLENLATLHGDVVQNSRDKIMGQFRSGSLRYLVATDVVGRGIDVSGISHIINYDIPAFCDDYVHRVGRTGRMGREGVAYTFVTAEEGAELTRIEMRINRLLKRADLKDFEAFAKPSDSSITDPFAPAQAKPVFGKPVRRIRKAL